MTGSWLIDEVSGLSQAQRLQSKTVAHSDADQLAETLRAIAPAVATEVTDQFLDLRALTLPIAHQTPR